MEWLTLISTLSGGVLGLAGGLLADAFKSRREFLRRNDADRHQRYVEYLLALTETDGALQLLAVANNPPLDRASLTQAWRQHSLLVKNYYVTLVAPADVADAAENAYNRLKDIREALASRKILVYNSPEWAEVHEPYIESITRLRGVMRRDVRNGENWDVPRGIEK
jgi:outer membrane protein assembly factor BamD (BamD/ComL family)